MADAIRNTSQILTPMRLRPSYASLVFVETIS